MTSEAETEPLLVGDPRRFTIFPIVHSDLWDFVKKMEALQWTREEVDMSRDRKDWDEKLQPDDRAFLKHQLAFFGFSDEMVLRNLEENMMEAVKCLEAKHFYIEQAKNERTHSECYSFMIEVYFSGTEREEVFQAVETMPIIGKMAAWAQRWINDRVSFPLRLTAFAVYEGVMFSASFAAIQWFKERNLLPGLTSFNEFIARDEGVHCLFACHILSAHTTNRPLQKEVHKIVKGAIALLDEFLGEAIPVSMIGMNVELMKQYVRFIADCLLLQISYESIYQVQNPFPFMDKLSLNGVAKSNFFEHRVSHYQKTTREGAAAWGIDESPVVY